jgi:hypothetical protein
MPDLTTHNELLDDKCRSGDFSKLKRNDKIRCYFDYWEYAKAQGLPPTKEELENRLDYKKECYYDYRTTKEKSLAILKKEVEARPGKKILMWTRAGAIAAIIAALSSLPLIIKINHYLAHWIKFLCK